MIRHAAWMKQTFLGKQNNEHMTLAQKKKQFIGVSFQY